MLAKAPIARTAFIVARLAWGDIVILKADRDGTRVVCAGLFCNGLSLCPTKC